MISIVRLFLLAHLWTAVPAAASSGGLLRGGSSRDSTRELGDSDSPWTDGADVHHQAGHLTAGRIEQRVIGGSKAPSTRYLYTVALMDGRGLFCGGVLISKDVVLSAAHCADGKTFVAIFAGSSHLPDNLSGNGEFAFPTRGWIHPKFEWATMENDFAVYLLDQPVSSDVEVVVVNNDSLNPSRVEKLIALGWGDTTHDPSTVRGSDDLMEVVVEYIPNNKCMDRSGFVGNNYITYKNELKDNMLCALDTGKDACQGDSGGPLIIEGHDSSGRKDVLVGLTSWGVTCAHETLPGVYARVSVGYEWIKSIVCENSLDPPDSFDCIGRDDGSNWDEGNTSGDGGNNRKGDNSDGKGDNSNEVSSDGKGDASLMGGSNGKGNNGNTGGNNEKDNNGSKGGNKGKGDSKKKKKKKKKKNKNKKTPNNKKKGQSKRQA